MVVCPAEPRRRPVAHEVKTASLTVTLADLPAVKSLIERLQAENDTLRAVLDDIYPSLASRAMQLEAAGEERAAEAWRDICDKVAATWPTYSKPEAK